MASGHPNGDFGAPFTLMTDVFSRSTPIAHHYQQRTRTCSTGCYHDCLAKDLPKWKSDMKKFMDHSLVFQKFGDVKMDFSQSGTVNWRHCQHRMESWGCPWQPFLTLKSDGKFPCKFPGVPDKSFTSGYLKEGSLFIIISLALKREKWSNGYRV